MSLATAQLTLAREYGFSSWARLKEEVEARTLQLAKRAVAFCQASVNGNTRRAARLLAESPAIADYSFATAVILGDADRVRDHLLRDPALATRPDPRTGWTALHAACASRWHQLEPVHADGLLAVVQLLLDAGADPIGQATEGRRGGAGWRPLRCAIAAANSGPSNRRVVELLLDAGADPGRYRDDDGRPTSIVWAAVRAGCDTAFLKLLLTHQAGPNTAGPDGRTSYQLATAAGRTDLAELLGKGGATDNATGIDRFLSACRHADRAEAQQLLDDVPGLVGRRRAGRDRSARPRLARPPPSR